VSYLVTTSVSAFTSVSSGPRRTGGIQIFRVEEVWRRDAEDRGAKDVEGGEVWGGVPLPTGGGVLLCPSPDIFFPNFRPRNGFFGAFWALYFTSYDFLNFCYRKLPERFVGDGPKDYLTLVLLQLSVQ